MVTRATLAWIFSLNPGTPLKFHLLDHSLGLLVQSYTIQTAICWLIVATLIVHEFYSKPRLLRVQLWMLLPLVVSCLLFGYLDELRDYYEVYPAVLLIGAFSLMQIHGHRV